MLFGGLMLVGFIDQMVTNFLGSVTDIMANQIIPEWFRDFVFWLATQLLPPISPFLNWLNGVGTAWSGLLAFVGLGMGLLLWKLEPNRF